jgi:hypothetical protein
MFFKFLSYLLPWCLLTYLFEHGYHPDISRDGGYIFKGRQVVAKVIVVDGVYVIDTGVTQFSSGAETSPAFIADIKPKSNAALWHCRLGHLNRRDMQLLSDELSYGFKLKSSDKIVDVPAML